MRVQRQRSSGRTGTLLKILISLVVIVGMAFSLAWVWHTTQLTAENGGGNLPQLPVGEASQPSLPEDNVVTPLAESSEEESGEESSEEDVSQDSDKGSAAASTVFYGALPASPEVDNSYFNDALFVGDSISTGIPLYHLADNAAVVAMIGINTDNINHKPVIDIGLEERITMLEACKEYPGRKKVYIMLGGNSMGMEKASFINGYKTFLDSLQELYPDAIFYLQSITPVIDGYVNEYVSDFTNEKIDEYNLEIMALAKRENAYYLDVASALKDETGALPAEASPTDGMHFSPEYYAKWFAYLRTHTVEVKK